MSSLSLVFSSARLSWLLTVAAAMTLAAPRAKGADGVLPLGADGKPLNLDFELGTLKDWTPQGDAFRGQPIKGEIEHRGRHSDKQGEFWIGTYEVAQDQPQGTLTSVPFKVTKPFAAFLVGGGSQNETRVEVVRKDSGTVIFKAVGRQQEDMVPAVVDLRQHQGKEIFIRLVDQSSGGWGHINFDDFRFYDVQPVLKTIQPAAGPDQYEHAGLTPDEAAKAMKLPEGFTATAFAGEPDVRQPIAMALDDRGRLWVAEAYSYPVRVPDAEARDQILIFEDVDGDGKFDKRTVFADKLNLVSGLELGFGGVWVGAAPNLLFIPDADGDDKPDGPPQVLLDGWGSQDTHETLNTFIWGPDGWLYGCHGVFTHSRVGKPGTPDDRRQPINAGIWRYHPTRHEFEVFAHGTSNPWGVDFNDQGQAFLTACVIPHLYHVIQSARYERQGGEHYNPFTYHDIKTVADHRHYLGGSPHGGNDRSDGAGGGHAHAGAMIYLGGAWPDDYRGKIFMNNIHGQRINMDVLKPRGSGYVGSHGPDFCLTNDRWSQILNLRYGPDGQAYMIDWYDQNACHHGNVAGHDRSNGRVFKICYGKSGPVAVDLKKQSDEQLAKLALEPNDWYVRHARRILQERAAQRALSAEALSTLRKIAQEHADESRRLRGLWTLGAVGALDESALAKALDDASPYVRGWAIQLGGDDSRRATSDAQVARFEQLAGSDPSPVVRLYLSSRLERLPRDKRWNIVTALAAHAEDADDHNLPCMYWYGLESLVTADSGRVLKIAADAKIPLLLSNTVRRLAAIGSPETVELLVAELARQDRADRQLAILEALNTSFTGRRQVAPPPSWSAAHQKLSAIDDGRIRSQLQTLATTFGDSRALTALRNKLRDAKAAPPLRQEALVALVKVKDVELPALLRNLLRDPVMRAGALRGLAGYDDAQTAHMILEVYDSLPPAEKLDALTTLCSRAPFAKDLLAAIAKGQVPSRDLSADLVRQLRNFNDAEMNKQLVEVWGTFRDTAADKVKLMAELKQRLATSTAPIDPSQGRALFAKTCQQCHTLFGSGGKVGPDLTGSNRANLDYLLSNVVDPSAVMAREYVPNVIVTDDGRLITGIIKAEDKNALTVQTQNELLVLPRSEIETIKPGEKSMMPDDLLKPLSDAEVGNLVAYLAGAKQVPMLATADNVAGFFNGKDLTGWSDAGQLWTVENGEIVGKTKGLDHNEFLKSDLIVGDFRFTVEVKLVANEGNSGIQFHSEALDGKEMKGCQADIGSGWWGKLYEESARGLLSSESGEQHVKNGEWNTYEIVAIGSRIRTLINGHECVNLDDAQVAQRGIFAFQLHSGGPTEVRFKNLHLELNPAGLGN